MSLAVAGRKRQTVQTAIIWESVAENGGNERRPAVDRRYGGTPTVVIMGRPIGYSYKASCARPG